MPEQPAPAPRRASAKATVLWVVISLALFGFLYGFPGYSAYALATMEPVDITVTDCYSGYGSSSGGCDGTWTEPDGSTGSGRVTDWRSDLKTGDVLEGVFISGQGRLSAVPWILDVAIVGPIALAFTGLVAWNYPRTRRKMREEAAGSELFPAGKSPPCAEVAGQNRVSTRISARTAPCQASPR